MIANQTIAISHNLTGHAFKNVWFPAHSKSLEDKMNAFYYELQN